MTCHPFFDPHQAEHFLRFHITQKREIAGLILNSNTCLQENGDFIKITSGSTLLTHYVSIKKFYWNN
ncbi:hypothetical protein BpHYR1_019742 [Brachionus plicatilis]|uniref:Uncharacterized protein n=1 Tax=Brachionus plicatilis TaxID=10195 RepID=A0A3M7RBS3_BRAPC|nr:hypothetical protein BpHYR1_019742 [Brachionus plicatilis]